MPASALGDVHGVPSSRPKSPGLLKKDDSGEEMDAGKLEMAFLSDALKRPSISKRNEHFKKILFFLAKVKHQEKYVEQNKTQKYEIYLRRNCRRSNGR